MSFWWYNFLICAVWVQFRTNIFPQCTWYLYIFTIFKDQNFYKQLHIYHSSHHLTSCNADFWASGLNLPVVVDDGLLSLNSHYYSEQQHCPTLPQLSNSSTHRKRWVRGHLSEVLTQMPLTLHGVWYLFCRKSSSSAKKCKTLYFSLNINYLLLMSICFCHFSV